MDSSQGPQDYYGPLSRDPEDDPLTGSEARRQERLRRQRSKYHHAICSHPLPSKCLPKHPDPEIETLDEEIEEAEDLSTKSTVDYTSGPPNLVSACFGSSLGKGPGDGDDDQPDKQPDTSSTSYNAYEDPWTLGPTPPRLNSHDPSLLGAAGPDPSLGATGPDSCLGATGPDSFLGGYYGSTIITPAMARKASSKKMKKQAKKFAKSFAKQLSKEGGPLYTAPFSDVSEEVD